MAYWNPNGTKTVIVEKGDCLSVIAEGFLGNYRRWREIAKLNKIPENNPIIHIGQVLDMDVDDINDPPTAKKSNTATVNYFGPLAGGREMIVMWDWTWSHTEKFRYIWYYCVSDFWLVGDDNYTKDETDDYKKLTYNPPENATAVRFKVLPISESKDGDDEESKTVYWTASWSTVHEYSYSSLPPEVPTPTEPTIKDNNLIVEYTNTDKNANAIQFRVVQDNKTVIHTSSILSFTTVSDSAVGYVKFTYAVNPGSVYKIYCRACRKTSKSTVYSDWSTFSSNVGTGPAAPSGLKAQANSETSVYLTWDASTNADSYSVEYTTDVKYFDMTDVQTGPTVTQNECIVTGLAAGDEYYFRVRAVNQNGESAWSQPVSCAIGTTPAAPTTWSSTTTAIVGEPLNLYWVHNSEDNSSETFADLEIIIGGVTESHTFSADKDYQNSVITYIHPTEEDIDKTRTCSINTSGYVEGTKIQWRMRTAGVTKKLGDWSIQRTIDIYAKPTLSLTVTDVNAQLFDELTSFPFYVSALAGPNTQAPIGYHVSIVADETYETVDDIGNTKVVNKGDSVYSKNFDISSPLLVELSANNVDLQNSISYTLTCSVTMNSGLTATATHSFIVAWTDETYFPNAEITLNTGDVSTYIRPYCEDEDGNLVEDLTLSVYRREFDGSFTEIANGLENSRITFVTDPHPALDYARYRVVAKTNSTGAVSFYDVPGFPVNEKAAIIQWDETWSSFDVYGNDDDPADHPWAGSLLRLPYNIDVSDSYSPDVSLVKYVGRKRPVGYYGTHHGETSTWSMAIDKKDTETLYALRRLAVWMGDVYVREPSGSGYWANIQVSFNQTHLDVTIPVTINVTRVEGGV